MKNAIIIYLLTFLEFMVLASCISVIEFPIFNVGNLLVLLTVAFSLQLYIIAMSVIYY